MFNLLKLLEERWKVTASLLKRITLYKTKENSIRHVSPSGSLISASDPTPATLNTPTSATSATSTTPVTPTTLDWWGLSPESLSLPRVFHLPPTYIFSTGIHTINKDPLQLSGLLFLRRQWGGGGLNNSFFCHACICIFRKKNLKKTIEHIILPKRWDHGVLSLSQCVLYRLNIL